MSNKIYSFLGLATKAGKLVSGDETCERAIKSGKALLVIVSVDASDNTKKKFSDKCSYRDVQMRFFGEKDLLGRYVGKEKRSVLAVIDINFAERLIELLDRNNFEGGGEGDGKNQSV